MNDLGTWENYKTEIQKLMYENEVKTKYIMKLNVAGNSFEHKYEKGITPDLAYAGWVYTVYPDCPDLDIFNDFETIT